MMMHRQEITVKAKASKRGDATSGKIIINTKGQEKILNAVVFTPKQSRKISEAVERAYGRARK